MDFEFSLRLLKKRVSSIEEAIGGIEKRLDEIGKQFLAGAGAIDVEELAARCDEISKMIRESTDHAVGEIKAAEDSLNRVMATLAAPSALPTPEEVAGATEGSGGSEATTPKAGKKSA